MGAAGNEGSVCPTVAGLDAGNVGGLEDEGDWRVKRSREPGG